ncbi:MAG TPA: serine hydrolase [Prolixibacteraceae bacterium]|nr:serine hydrolase [Prolixibacteraceae bacterium]
MKKNFFVFQLLLSLIFLSAVVVLPGCAKEETPGDPDEKKLYFPPVNSSAWETTTPESLSWNVENLDPLYKFLSDNGTRAFIVLKDGRIVIEKYWGTTILNNATFEADSEWYWASAGKTIIAFLVGIAQQENLLDIDDKTSDYLGEGWTSMDAEKENLITIRHQLTMTTGLDYLVKDLNCTFPGCLHYKNDAGNQWFYHNAPYLLLKEVLNNASGTDYDTFTDQKLEAQIGMSGKWIGGVESMYWSTPRDMARFGLLNLNKGKWNDTQVLTGSNYFNEMTSSSQSLNPSYGFLWWLNGKSSIVLPGLPLSLNTELAANAPDDLITGAGKNGQFVDIVPSKNIVVVRMGEAPDGSALAVQFHNKMWEKLNFVIPD